MTIEIEIDDEMVMVSQPVDVAAFTAYVEENSKLPFFLYFLSFSL